MDLPDFTDLEVRVTAQERLDLHFEHLDALSVQRGSRTLADHLRGFASVEAGFGSHRLSGRIECVGQDWVQTSQGLIRPSECDGLWPQGEGAAPRSRLEFRQILRRYAGRIPREVVVAGQLRLMVIDWVGADFAAVTLDGRRAVVPLGQIGAVFGALG